MLVLGTNKNNAQTERAAQRIDLCINVVLVEFDIYG